MGEALPLIRARLNLSHAIAVGESEPIGKLGTGYNILFGGGRFEGFAAFPDWPGRIVNGRPTHAAGRYQFQPGTWGDVSRAIGLRDFSPASQDAGFWFLACQRYRLRVGRSLGPDLLADLLDELVYGLQPTWTSVSAKTIARYRSFRDG